MSKITYIDHIAKLLPLEEVQDFQSCYQQKLPKTIKIISSKISVQNFQDLVLQRGWKLEKTNKSDCFYVHVFTWSSTLGQHFLHQGGFFYIQELSASMSAPLLEAKPGELILDMCAAPGGKTVQLADQWSFVVANEPLNPRRKALIYNLNRTGMINTAITNIDGSRFGSRYPEMFDKILVDAPCSGEGMSYKTGWPISWNEWLVNSLARGQEKLLTSAIETCKPWGTIVYSTCTLNERENEEVITAITKKYEGVVSLEFSKKYRPHRDHCGGFFVAKMVKTLHSNVYGNDVKTFCQNVSTPQKIPLKAPDFDFSKSLQSQVREYLFTSFWIQNIWSHFLFFSTQNTIYATTQEYINIHGKISLDKAGVPLFDIARDKKRIPNHHVGSLFGHLATKNVFQLTDEQAQAYASQKDLSLPQNIETTTDNFVLITWKWYGYSLGKYVNKMIKNKMS